MGRAGLRAGLRERCTAGADARLHGGTRRDARARSSAQAWPRAGSRARPKDGEGGYSAKDCVLYYNIKNTETEPVQGITTNWRLVTPSQFISDEIRCNLTTEEIMDKIASVGGR